MAVSLDINDNIGISQVIIMKNKVIIYSVNNPKICLSIKAFSLYLTR